MTSVNPTLKCSLMKQTLLMPIAESYYDAVYDDYMVQLDSLNYAMDSFTMQISAVVQSTDSNTTLSNMSPIINLSKIVREQESKSPRQQVQSVVQNNETVLMNTHNCTCQPLPSQQVQEDMSIELVHLSTCVHDHTALNCDQSLLDLHIDIKAQSEVSISTITMEQQHDLFDCEPPVTIQCSPVSLDTHIDQTDLHVQSPAPCAQYSHTHHATIHHASIVPSPIQLANSRSTDHHVLNAPPQHPLELKVSSVCSQTPRPDRIRKSKMVHSPANQDLPLASFCAELLRFLSVEMVECCIHWFNVYNITVILFCKYILQMYLVSQRSTM